MSSSVFYSPAKINLFLYVTGKRPDGYHNIYTLFYPVSIYDKLIIKKADKTEIICNDKTIPVDDSNTIIRTDKILKERYNLKDNYKITLEKNIPTGAGLGGGSSNCAVYLKAVNQLSNLGLTYSTMAEIMSDIGSDTVYFLNPVPMLAFGRGTELQNAPKLPELYFIIINPKIHISTKEIYNHKKLQLTNINSINMIKEEYSFDELKTILHNDMQTPVFEMYPQVKELVDYFNGTENGCGLMSGSGSSVFGVFGNIEERDKEYKKLKAKYNNYFIETAQLWARG